MSKDSTKASSQENSQRTLTSAKQWVVSDEGQRAVQSSLERARTLAAKFREAEVVDPDILGKPVSC